MVKTAMDTDKNIIIDKDISSSSKIKKQKVGDCLLDTSNQNSEVL